MPFGGTTVKDVGGQAFINMYAQHLKRQGKMEYPPWADLVKTAPFKELPPSSEDWYFERAASIARRLYLSPGAGVGRLRKHYGGKARRGVRKERYATASGGLIRHILQQLEKIKVVEIIDKSGGRKLTSTGQQDLDRIAGSLKEQFVEEEEAVSEDESESESSEEESEDSASEDSA